MKDEIKILLIKKKSNLAKLAQDLNISKNNLYNQLNRDNLRVNMLKDIAQALDAELEIRFKPNNDESQDIIWRSRHYE